MPGRQNFLEIYRPERRQSLLAASILLVCLLAFRLQALPHLASVWIGGAQGDAGLYVWLFRNAAESLFSEAWFNTQAFYPYTRSLAWSDNFILPSLIGLPFLKLGLPAALVYNLLILAAGLLNGYFTWRLAYRLTGSFLPSLTGGIAFMIFSGFTANLGHPQLQFAFWLPLAVESTLPCLEVPSLKTALLTGLYITLAFLCSVYFAVYALLAVCCYFGSFVLLRPGRLAFRHYGLIAAGLLAGIVPLLPFILPYLDVRTTFGERGIYEFYYFAASLVSYFSSSQFNLIYSITSAWGHDEARLFPGIAVFALSAVAFSRLGGTKRLRPSFLLLFGAIVPALVLSLPFFHTAAPRYVCALLLWISLGAMGLLLYRLGALERKLGVTIMTNRALLAQIFFSALMFFAISFGPLGAPDGNPQKGQYAPGVLTFFYYLFPGMDSLRAVGRAGLVCVFFLTLSLPFAVKYITEKAKQTVAMVVALLCLIAIENYNLFFPLEKLLPAPTVLEQIPARPSANEAILFLPLTSRLDDNKRVKSWGDFARLNTTYMNWMPGFKLRLVNGYSGQRPKLLEELPRELAAFPDRRSLNALSSIAALRYIVYCSRFDPAFNRQDFFTRINTASWLRLIAADDEGNYLFELIAQTPLGADFSLLLPSYPQSTVRLELMATNAKEGSEVPVDIILKSATQEIPAAAASVRASGTWDFYSFRVPQSSDTVRPVRLLFRVQNGAQVFLRQSKVDYDHD